MTRRIRRSVSSAKPKLSVTKAKNGIVTVKAGKFVENIDVNGMGKWEQIEAVRWAVLRAGFVFSSKVEKMARRNLSV